MRVDKTVDIKKVEQGILLVTLIAALAFIAFWRNQILDFIYRYFIQTMGWGYNPINTVVYSVTLVFFICIVARLLVKLGVEPDERFILSTSPYIIIGSAGRALKDLGFFESILFRLAPDLLPNLCLYFALFNAFTLRRQENWQTLPSLFSYFRINSGELSRLPNSCEHLGTKGCFHHPALHYRHSFDRLTSGSPG